MIVASLADTIKARVQSSNRDALLAARGVTLLGCNLGFPWLGRHRLGSRRHTAAGAAATTTSRM
jgi:hypothetical protein